MVVPFAVDGLAGVTAIDCSVGALLVKEFFQQEIRDGRLIQPFDIVVDTADAYWLAFPEARRNVPKIREFRDWIVDEITAPAKDGAPAAISG